ncbi:hypothetical protein EVAR_65816_1 [Eumeta japonica]|uniref:Uncharacterized protein n=1 Tax=Eumeta variegata TaxID=151549 RepID=A0A4C1ZNM4_EUMVA|nr:hypothetical protein EVAR_65816_1 [Eumeta japonica]
MNPSSRDGPRRPRRAPRRYLLTANAAAPEIKKCGPRVSVQLCFLPVQPVAGRGGLRRDASAGGLAERAAPGGRRAARPYLYNFNKHALAYTNGCDVQIIRAICIPPSARAPPPGMARRCTYYLPTKRRQLSSVTRLRQRQRSRYISRVFNLKVFIENVDRRFKYD